jgi:hypothetical protein
MRKPTLTAALAILLAGCATLKVESQSDPKADFAAYKTYAWDPTPPSKEEADAMQYPEAVAMVRQAVDRELAARGLKLVEGDQADLMAAAHGHGKNRLVVLDSGYKQATGPLGYSGPLTGAPTVSINDARVYRDGTLILDLVDRRTGAVVWRGTASDTVTEPSQVKAVVDGAVKRMLADYPPGRK